MNCGALTSLLAMLNSHKAAIRKEACWTISNITAGNKDQIQACIYANVFQALIQLMAQAEFVILVIKTRGDTDCFFDLANLLHGGREAAWVCGRDIRVQVHLRGAS